MNRLRLVWVGAVALIMVGCERRQTDSTSPSTNTIDPEQERLVQLAAEARRWEQEADVVLIIEDGAGDDTVRLVWPELPGFTKSLSTKSDFQVLAAALPKRDSAVIQMWAMGWNTNRATSVAAGLREAGFSSVRLVALRWGRSWPGPPL